MLRRYLTAALSALDLRSEANFLNIRSTLPMKILIITLILSCAAPALASDHATHPNVSRDF